MSNGVSFKLDTLLAARDDQYADMKITDIYVRSSAADFCEECSTRTLAAGADRAALGTMVREKLDCFKKDCQN